MYSMMLQGRRSLQLQKWRHLIVSVQNASAFSSSFSSASDALVSSTDGEKRQVFNVSYLVDSLGLTTKLAESFSRKFSFGKKGNLDSVLNLLRNYGFTDSQISSIITDYPKLLIADAEKSLGPKLKFLESRGASSSELTEILSKAPKILGVKEGKSSSRYYDCVKEIIEADKSSKFEKLSQSFPQGMQENKIRNVWVLRELGTPQKNLFSLLITHGSSLCGKEKFEESLKKVIEMGFDPTTSTFAEVLRIVQCLSDKTIEEKLNVYKKLGFSVGDVWEIFRKYPIFLTLSEKKILNSIETLLGLGFTRDEVTVMVKCFPQCLSLSAETVKKKTEFLVKTMNWSLKVVAFFPQVFGLSMEKWIVPRSNVIKALMSKGFFKDKGSELLPLTSVLACSDQRFLKSYVNKYDDKELVAIFTKGRVS